MIPDAWIVCPLKNVQPSTGDRKMIPDAWIVCPPVYTP